MFTLLAKGLFDCDGHDVHVDRAKAAVVVENVLIGHAVHEAEPVTCLYVPATHAVHVFPFAPV